MQIEFIDSEDICEQPVPSSDAEAEHIREMSGHQCFEE